MASENVDSLSRPLHISANLITNASTDANNVDRLILVYNVCIEETSKSFQQRIKQTTFVVISAWRVICSTYTVVCCGCWYEGWYGPAGW